MELLELHQIATNKLASPSRDGLELAIRLQKQLPGCCVCEYDSLRKCIQLSLIIAEEENIRIFGKLTMNIQDLRIRLILSPANKTIIRCKSKQQISLLIRYLLRRNRETQLNFKVHPLTGEPSGNFTGQIYDVRLGTEQIKDILRDLIQLSAREFQKEITHIMFQLGLVRDFQGDDAERQQFHLTKLKVYLQSSQHYAWNILQGSNKNFKNQLSRQHFYQRKDNFLKQPRYYCENELVRNLQMMYGSQSDSIEFQPLSADEDQNLYDRYLAKISMIIKDAKQCNFVSLNTDSLPSAIKKMELQMEHVISCQGIGNVMVAIKKFPPSMVKRLEYQKQIIDRLSGFQFVGVAKYYYITNCGKETEKLRITNLVKIRNFKRFLQANQLTVSLHTKLSLLYQVTVAIKFLRDHNIVFHNLIPDNVMIKKGLLVKLCDFTNAYATTGMVTRQRFNSPFFQLYQNKPPYVVNVMFGKNRTFDDQKADIYSLGVMAFESIFGKCPNDIKPSKLKNPNQANKIFKDLTHPGVHSIERYFNEPKTTLLVVFMLLQCIDCHQVGQQTEQSSSQNPRSPERLFTRNRPFTDWMVVIFKIIFQYFNKNGV